MAEDDGIRRTVEAKMTGEFMPVPDRNRPWEPDARMADALECIAHHIGKIDDKLTTITEALKELVRASRT